jgi:hypothetical protein
MTSVIALPLAGDVARALERLTSLHDGDLGVIEITACGSRAVPALRALLLEGAASGIYQPRCRAVEALAALGADDVLIEFLKAPRDVPDPVNRTGEDAVINVAARALIGSDDKRIFPVLMALAPTRLLAGVVEALGALGGAEALPILIRALGEDHTRGVAEAALGRLGAAARPALSALATRPLPAAAQETVSSRRMRLSALGLLVRIGAPGKLLRDLLGDADPEIAAMACRALLAAVGTEDGGEAVRRLIALLPRLSLIACAEAEDCLAEHFDSARDIILARLREDPPDPADASPRARAYRALLRIARRA